MTEIPVYWPIRGQDSPPLWESTLEDITDIADMTRRWHEIMESGVKSQRCVFTFQRQVQLWGANLRNMRDLSRTKDQEHVENDGSIAISLLVAVALALSWSIVSIAAYSNAVSSFLYKRDTGISFVFLRSNKYITVFRFGQIAPRANRNLYLGLFAYGLCSDLRRRRWCG